MAVISTMSRVIAVPFVAMTLTLHGCSTGDCKKPATDGYSIEDSGTLTVGEDFSVNGTCDAAKGYAGKFNASTCAEAGEEYKLSGCDKTACAWPEDIAQYVISTNPSAPNYKKGTEFSVEYTCADGYAKKAEDKGKAVTCENAGDKFTWGSSDNDKCLKQVDCGTAARASCTACDADAITDGLPCKGTESSGTAYTGWCEAETNCAAPA